MDQLKRILVAIDFSESSAAALRQAVRIAALNRAAVAAVHVVSLPVYAIPHGSFLPMELPPVADLLDSGRQQWATWPPAREVGRDVAFEAVMGMPRAELIDRVRRESIDLLVVGASGADGHTRLGSTASGCVQRAATKVLAVRRGRAAAFRAVVACIDFSDTSRLALDQAIRIAAQDGATLHILHVYADPWQGRIPEGVRSHMPDLSERYQAAVEQHLRTFCKPFEHEIGALKATIHALQCRGHGKGIVEFIQREHCDLAVIGTRSTWNARDFLLGSTAERIAREAPCSILTIKPPGFADA
ncbi:MAG: universal stress protein [Phycisphaerales bacterium]|nr:universal stress protein [Phycisphaerales bacterium]